jgi:DNA replication protein DnaC/primosomal protein DnaI
MSPKIREENRVDGEERGKGRLISPAEAMAAGLVDQEPDKVPCPHCGKPLDQLGAVFAGKVYWVSHARCGCQGERREDREVADAAETAEQGEKARLLARAGVPAKFADATLTDGYCRAYVDSFVKDETSTGLYVHGPVGTGKTYNAAGIVKALIAKKCDAIFSSALDIFTNIQETYDSGSSSKREMERYLSCGILVLDDLGKESNTRWALTMLFTLVNARYERMLPTVITSQYTMEGLRQRLSQKGERETAEAIVSRLSETCMDVTLVGGDRRRVETSLPMRHPKVDKDDSGQVLSGLEGF